MGQGSDVRGNWRKVSGSSLREAIRVRANLSGAALRAARAGGARSLLTPLEGVMRFKRITLDGMKWWVPCFSSDRDYARCFSRERALAFDAQSDVQSHNPEVLA